MNGGTDAFPFIVRLSAATWPVPHGLTAHSFRSGMITVAWKLVRTPQRPLEGARISRWETTTRGFAHHGFAEKGPRIVTIAVAPFSVFAPVIESDAMFVVRVFLRRLRSIPASKSETLAIDPTELAFPLDIGAANPKFRQSSESAGDSALLGLGGDDRELGAFHFAESFGTFPIGLFGMIQITSSTNGLATFAHDGTVAHLTGRSCISCVGIIRDARRLGQSQRHKRHEFEKKRHLSQDTDNGRTKCDKNFN